MEEERLKFYQERLKLAEEHAKKMEFIFEDTLKLMKNLFELLIENYKIEKCDCLSKPPCSH